MFYLNTINKFTQDHLTCKGYIFILNCTCVKLKINTNSILLNHVFFPVNYKQQRIILLIKLVQ